MAHKRSIPLALVCLCAFYASALEYVFPPGAKVIDVTQAPYSADRTGATDVSAILSKAINDDINVANWCPRFVYLPAGTYLVKNTIQWKVTSHGNGNGPIMVGQSRTGTVIKLAKGTWPLGTELKGAIWTGAGDENNFNKGIRNLTVLVDSNNAGAIGIIYVSDNVGMISDVDVISADGKGAYGIQSAGGIGGVGGNGPFIIRRTYIKGFQVGMRTCGSEGAMCSQIRLEGQSKYGIWASCGDLIVDSLTTNDTCIAVEAEAAFMLTNAVLAGGSPTAYGIRNFATSSFFRDIKTSGYKFAISSVGTNRPPLVSSFNEYAPVAPVSLFSAAKTSMNIPARYPPEVAWENDPAKWAFIDDYKTGGRNDAQAFQAAIDDPTKSTVCLPNKVTRSLSQPIYVRGTIRRIIGTGSQFGLVNKSTSQIIIDDGSAPAVILQNFGGLADPANFGQIIKRTNRTAILETWEDGFHVVITGGGETYLTDLSLGSYLIDNAQARVYMWQFEGANCSDSIFVVRNGMVRAVGFYKECTGSSLVCTGGFTELLGGWIYSTMCNHSSKFILTVKNNANVSAAGLFQQNFCNPWGGYDQLVSETQSGTTRILYGSAGTGRTVSPAGANVALFTAYDSAQVAQLLGVGVRPATAHAERSLAPAACFQKAGEMGILYRTEMPGPAMLIAYDLTGRIIAVVNDRPAAAGMHRTMMPRIPGVACIQVRSHGRTAQRLSAAQ